MASEQHQGQPASPIPPQAPPPGGGRSRLGLLIGGGCAVAAVLGFLTVIIIGALLFFFLNSTASPQEPETPPTQPETTEPETNQPQQAPAQPESGSEPPPEGGGLDGLVQQEVGNFSLQQIEEIPDAIGAGATDARTMLYASPDGVQIAHDLTAWPSPDTANQQITSVGDALASEGFQVAEEFAVEDEQGQQIGSGVILVGEVEGATIEAILWSNDVLFCSIFAPEGYSVDFYNSLPY